MGNYTKVSYVGIICLLLSTAAIIAYPNTTTSYLMCKKDNDGRCCPPVTICGGAYEFCDNGCHNSGNNDFENN